MASAFDDQTAYLLVDHQTLQADVVLAVDRFGDGPALVVDAGCVLFGGRAIELAKKSKAAPSSPSVPMIYDYSGKLPVPKDVRAGDKVKMVMDMCVDSVREHMQKGKRVRSFDLKVDKAKQAKGK